MKTTAPIVTGQGSYTRGHTLAPVTTRKRPGGFPGLVVLGALLIGVVIGAWLFGS